MTLASTTQQLPDTDPVVILGIAEASALQAMANEPLLGDGTGIISCGDLAALTAIDRGAISPGVSVDREALARHMEILLHVSSKITLVPLRYPTVAKGASEVRGTLEDNHDAYKMLLAEFTDKVEINVKGRPREDALLARVVLEPAIRRMKGAKGTSAKLALGELVATRVEAEAARAAAVVAERLTNHAIGVSGGALVEGTALNCSFLLGRNSVEAFRAHVSEAEREIGGVLELAVSDPLPPYSFVQLSRSPSAKHTTAADRRATRAGRAQSRRRRRTPLGGTDRSGTEDIREAR